MASWVQTVQTLQNKKIDVDPFRTPNCVANLRKKICSPVLITAYVRTMITHGTTS